MLNDVLFMFASLFGLSVHLKLKCVGLYCIVLLPIVFYVWFYFLLNVNLT